MRYPQTCVLSRQFRVVPAHGAVNEKQGAGYDKDGSGKREDGCGKHDEYLSVRARHFTTDSEVVERALATPHGDCDKCHE